MKRRCGIILFCILAAAQSVSAQTPPVPHDVIWDEDIVETGTRGIITAAGSIFSDLFTPMTHYRPGEWTVTLAPAYFQVSRISLEPVMKGKNLEGYGGGLGGGYAFNEHVMVYALAGGMKTAGNIAGRSDKLLLYKDFDAKVKFDIFAAYAGAGFDVFGGSKNWSMPIYVGAFTQKYDAELKFRPLNTKILDSIIGAFSYSSTIGVDVSGEDWLYGVSAGIALSRNFFDTVRITPYYIYSKGLRATSLHARAYEDIRVQGSVLIPFDRTTSFSHDHDVDIRSTDASVAGLCVSIISQKSWTFSLGIGTSLAAQVDAYSKSLGGLRMLSIALSVTYNGGRAPDSSAGDGAGAR